MTMKRAIVLSMLIALFPLTAAQAATPKPGLTCIKVGAKSTYRGQSLICTKVGKKLQWKAVATKSPSPSPSVTSYSASTVAEHSNQESCWTIVDGKVYDVTQWINSHPGGPDKILGMCGHDGTSAFRGQHQNRNDRILAAFYIGVLAVG